MLTRKQERLMRREIRRDLIDLRMSNLDATSAEFEQLARAQVEEEYDGIDPETLAQLIEIMLKLLPLILLLF